MQSLGTIRIRTLPTSPSRHPKARETILPRRIPRHSKPPAHGATCAPSPHRQDEVAAYMDGNPERRQGDEGLGGGTGEEESQESRYSTAATSSSVAEGKSELIGIFGLERAVL
jgi:hypothetical protein